MVAETATLEVITTQSEVEALLLESNLIKRLTPRYNVSLRDDKSFPYILITGDHPAPQVLKHRGAHNRAGDFYGPFASAGAVNATITALQRAFLLRSCSDSVYASRTRPCLQYQIKRCSGPCVDRIGGEDYAALVAEAREFLAGKSREVQQRLAVEMQTKSEALEFEAAARLRDRIRALAQIQSHQAINVAGLDEADVIAAHQAGGNVCIQVFFFRAGSNYGNRAYFPSHAGAAIASNYLVTLHHAASDLFQRAGAPPEALLPLMQRVIDNGFELTGPIARGDWRTVEAHLEAIRRYAPELEPMYVALARQTGYVVGQQGPTAVEEGQTPGTWRR